MAKPESTEEGTRQAQLMVKENPVAFAVAGVLLLLLLGRLLSR